jgi:hypothetical protein
MLYIRRNKWSRKLVHALIKMGMKDGLDLFGFKVIPRYILQGVFEVLA